MLLIIVKGILLVSFIIHWVGLMHYYVWLCIICAFCHKLNLRTPITIKISLLNTLFFFKSFTDRWIEKNHVKTYITAGTDKSN